MKRTGFRVSVLILGLVAWARFLWQGQSGLDGDIRFRLFSCRGELYGWCDLWSTTFWLRVDWRDDTTSHADVVVGGILVIDTQFSLCYSSSRSITETDSPLHYLGKPSGGNLPLFPASHSPRLTSAHLNRPFDSARARGLTSAIGNESARDSLLEMTGNQRHANPLSSSQAEWSEDRTDNGQTLRPEMVTPAFGGGFLLYPSMA